MTFAFDYDGTLKSSAYHDKSECRMWAEVFGTLINCGHSILIVTMRNGSEADREDVERWRGLANVIYKTTVIYCGERGLKDEVCRSEGYRVDIWVDDMPDSIRQPVPMIGMGGE